MNNDQALVQAQKKSEARTQIFALVAALILAAVLASGCSTPPVTGTLNTNPSPAVSYSYGNCVQVMTSYGLQNECNSVNTPTATSYEQYTGSKNKKAAAVVSEASLQEAYQTYLASLDQQTLNEMNAQWDAIVASVSK